MIATDPEHFQAALLAGGALMGLDVGTKTIGVALCDAGWIIASPFETVARTRFAGDLSKLSRIVDARSVAGLVVGLPLNLDGSDSPRTQSVRAFACNLAALELPTLLWDERWSTMAVNRALIDADYSRKRRAAIVDKAAAAYILQGAIDALRSERPSRQAQ